MKRIVLTLILFASLFTSNLYSNTSEIPNEKVFDNPKKEVTTVEANKNKEHAEMNIKVNKLNIQEIKGYDIGDGKIQYFIPKEENKLLKTLTNNKDNQYLVFENKEQLSEYLNKNKKTKNKRSVPQSIPFEVIQDEEQTMLTVNNKNNIYILDTKNKMRVFLGKNTEISTYASPDDEFGYKLRVSLNEKWANWIINNNYVDNSFKSVNELCKLPLAGMFVMDLLYVDQTSNTNLNYILQNGDRKNVIYAWVNGSTYKWTDGSSNFISEGFYSENGGRIEKVRSQDSRALFISPIKIHTSDVDRFKISDFENMAREAFKVKFSTIRNTNSYIIGSYMKAKSGSSVRVLPAYAVEYNGKGSIQRGTKGSTITVSRIKSINTFYHSKHLGNSYGGSESAGDDITWSKDNDMVDNTAIIKDIKRYVHEASFFYEQLNGTDIIELAPSGSSNDDWQYPKIKFKKSYIPVESRFIKVELKVKMWGNIYTIRKFDINLSKVLEKPIIKTLDIRRTIPNKEYEIDLTTGIGKTTEYRLNPKLDSDIHKIDLGGGISDYSRVELKVNGQIQSNFNNADFILRISNNKLYVTRKEGGRELDIELHFYDSSRQIINVFAIKLVNQRVKKTDMQHSIQVDRRFFRAMQEQREDKLYYNGNVKNILYWSFFNEKVLYPSAIQNIAHINGDYNLTNTSSWITDNNYGFQKMYSPLDGYKNMANFKKRAKNFDRDTVNLLYLGNDGMYQNLNITIIDDSTIPMDKIYFGSGEIDISKMTKDKVYTFNSIPSTKISNNGVDLIHKGDFITTGTSFNENSNIVNKIVVTNSSSSGSSSNGQTNGNNYWSDGEVEVKISTNSLLVKKLQDLSQDKILKIDYYYNELLLGTYTLTLKGKPPIEIEGIDQIKFGILEKGIPKILSGSFLVKNIEARNIIKVDIPKNGAIKHISSEEIIPLKIENTQIKRGKNMEVRATVTASPKKNQAEGKYTGEILLTITIE